MGAPTQDIIDRIIAGGVTVTRRVDIFYPDGTEFVRDVPITGGSISVDSSRDERRTFELTIENDGNWLWIGPDGLWYDKVIKIYRGIEWSDGSWETLLGTFVIDSMEQAHFPSEVRLTGRDFTKKILMTRFATSGSFDKGGSLYWAIAFCAWFYGPLQPEDLIFGDPESLTVPKVLGEEGGDELYSAYQLEGSYTFEVGDPIWDLMKKMATDSHKELFFNTEGKLICRDFRDPSKTAPAYTFNTGANGNLVSYTKRANDSQLYNHVIVIGENGKKDNDPVFGEAKVTDASLPTHSSKIGDRIFVYKSKTITNADTCKSAAQLYLIIFQLEEFNIDLNSIAFPWLEAGEIIQFDDPTPYPEPNMSTRFLLHDFTIPLTVEAMSLNGRRLQIVK